jgi:hypothetical protein
MVPRLDGSIQGHTGRLIVSHIHSFARHRKAARLG